MTDPDLKLCEEVQTELGDTNAAVWLAAKAAFVKAGLTDNQAGGAIAVLAQADLLIFPCSWTEKVETVCQRLHAILSVDVGKEVAEIEARRVDDEIVRRRTRTEELDAAIQCIDDRAKLLTLLRAAMANQRPPPEGCEWVAVCKTCWCDPEHAGRCRDRDCPLRASPGRGK